MDNAKNTVYIIALSDMQGYTCSNLVVGGVPVDAKRELKLVLFKI